jgi:phospholipid/cholesterol/gamma-HCH transport system substrate-binding protein
MATGSRREIAVGALALLGVVLFFVGTLVLKGGNIGGGRQWTVLFADVNGLKRGSPVQISGYAVGHVTEIELRKPGEVAVQFVLPDEMPLQSDAVIQVSSVGLVGDVLLRVDPGKSPVALDPATPIMGSAQGPGLTAQAEELSEQVGRVTEGAALILNEQTANEIHRSLRALERMLNTYGDPEKGPAVQLTRTMGSVQLLTEELRRTLQAQSTNNTLANADTLTRNLARASQHADSLVKELQHTSAALDTLLSRINRGEGTLGKLATDTSLYNDARRTSAALTALLDEIRQNPGKLTIQFKVF